MQILRLALATITLTAGALAQCGLNQLTTGPAFASNNGGSVGGMVYFTLNVTAPGGISICGIVVNTSVSGAPINGEVYLHQTLTDWNLLDGTTNTVADWCLVAQIAGTGNGANVPSPCVVVNTTTNSIDLPMGDYLLAVGNGDFDHDYTNGTGCPGNQCVMDPNLGFDGGLGSNTFYTASLFNPRIFNATFDYNVNTATTLSQCIKPSSCVTVGTSCGGSAATIAEDFGAWDLSDSTALPPTTTDVTIAGSGGTVIVDTVVGGSAIVAPLSADLGLGDDESSSAIPLGFDLSAFGVCGDSISVQSNGCIWLGNVGSGDFSETLGEFESQGARVAVYWEDLRSLTGGGPFGTIHVDQSATETLVTWLGVELWGATVPVTFQCSITANLITCRYDALSAFANDGLVGFHNGVATTGTLSSDLTAGPITAISSPQIDLACVQAPTLGGTFALAATGFPGGGLGAILLDIGPTSAGTALPNPPFAVGCLDYTTSSTPLSLGLIMNANPCLAYAGTVAIPANTAFLCLPFAAQAAGITLGGEIVMSNGVDAVTGDL